VLKAFVNAFKIPDLRKKILFTLFIIAVFRFGSHLPVPIVDINKLQSKLSGNTNNFLSFINLFSGGALTNMAVFALGIMPYITSSIIMQLLTVVIPRLPQQGTAILKQAGAAKFYTILAIAFGIIVAVVFMEQGQRRIPVQYAKRVVGRRMYGGQSTYIPLKVNQAGVIPIIFAVSVLYFPQLLASTIHATWLQNFVNNQLGTRGVLYMLIYGLLVIFFAYFYTAITFNPTETADNIRKYGGFIPGIRPGRPTAEYLNNILVRITLPGSLFLASIALLPSIFLALYSIPQFPFGGTAILITVGVALETMKQLESQLLMRHYEGFLR